MILGKIVGKTSTKNFKFKVDGKAKKFQFVQFIHDDAYVLAQITELERDVHDEIAYCDILGYNDDGKLRRLVTPPIPEIEILEAQDHMIENVLGLDNKKDAAFIGVLEGRENLKINLDLNKILTKHVAILAKSGAGKSYCSGVLIEELLEKDIPIVIIDPHGEYNTLKYKNEENEEGLGYLNKIQEYSCEENIIPGARILKLNQDNLTAGEITKLLPAKLSNAQLSLLYSSLRDQKDNLGFDDILYSLEQEDNNIKWTLMNVIDYLKKTEIFSKTPTSMQELVRYGKCSIINLKGTNPDVQEVVVYKLLRDLFDQRKKGNIPPFFLVIEEAQNYIPERTFGEAKSSEILRQILSEGRKFGLSCCLISQRPARVDKTALSQVSTQFILRVTNPNDIRAIMNSLEGITGNTEKEISNVPIGTAMVVGVVDIPLFVNVRPRKTKHGGEAINILGEIDNNLDSEEEDYKEILPVIKPKLSRKDLEISGEKVTTKLIPCALLNLKEYNLLVNLTTGKIIKNVENLEEIELAKSEVNLSPKQTQVFEIALKLNSFKPAELFSKSGLQFSDIYEIIKVLTEKGYFVKNGDQFSVNDKYKTMINLKDYETHETVDFSKVNYDVKEEKKFSLNDVVENIKGFNDVSDSKECWLMVHNLG